MKNHLTGVFIAQKLAKEDIKHNRDREIKSQFEEFLQSHDTDISMQISCKYRMKLQMKNFY